MLEQLPSQNHKSNPPQRNAHPNLHHPPRTLPHLLHALLQRPLPFVHLVIPFISFLSPTTCTLPLILDARKFCRDLVPVVLVFWPERVEDGRVQTECVQMRGEEGDGGVVEGGGAEVRDGGEEERS